MKMLMMVFSRLFIFFNTLRNFLNGYYVFLQDAQSLVERNRHINQREEELQVCDSVCRVQRVDSGQFYGK